MSTTLHEGSSLPRLRAELSGELILPGDAGYDDARRVFAAGVDHRPAAVVRPLHASGVATVVSFARDHDLELAVRSGGHSAAGHGTSEGGVVLDLSRLRTLTVDPRRRVAVAGTGLTAGDVTAAAGAHGLAVPFGDTGSVGIGGLTLGGGIGYLVRRHGLTADSLLAAELVTAEGRLLRVDAEHHPDLFWAIRGGGGNFGVATRFRYRLHPVDPAIGGMLMLPATPETVAGFVAAADEAPAELSTIANVMPAPPLPFVPEEVRGRLVVLAMLLHAGGGRAGERAIVPFRALADPLADLVRPLSYAEMFPPADDARGPLVVLRTLFVDAIDTSAAADLLDRLRSSTAETAVAQIRVLGGALSQVPDDATAFAHRKRRALVNVAALYSTPDERPVHEAWAGEAVARLSAGTGGAYVNFLGDEGQERVRAAYPGATWDRLVEVKRRYDPENLFRLNQNVAPS
jgi:FAD/FMN-containing dehydrogenase